MPANPTPSQLDEVRDALVLAVAEAVECNDMPVIVCRVYDINAVDKAMYLDWDGLSLDEQTAVTDAVEYFAIEP